MAARPEARGEARVSDAEFAAAVSPHLHDGGPIAVAVSGGADSMAVLRLLHAWAEPRGVAVVALTVDHRLRDGSAAEARQVAAWCRGLGVRHVTLPWDEGPAQRGL